ncbi:hypothetical protein OG381_04240 [Streptomyces sp. NBC_00490]|uniref:hypothetical protein n=1 Tax=Streptomyces sp. NBC_00490 TaxID=2903657 RepID=UPI002E170C9C
MRASGWCVRTATAPPPRENGDVPRRPFPAEPSLAASSTAVTRRSLIATTYVQLALELGVPSGRINRIIDFAGAARNGTKAEGSAAASSADVLRELAALIADTRTE